MALISWIEVNSRAKRRLAELLLALVLPLRLACGASTGTSADLTAAAKSGGGPTLIENTGAALRPSREIVYKRIDGHELHLEIFLPSGFKAENRCPALIAFHGGGWAGGGPSAMYAFAQHFAEAGRVAISVQYRLFQPGTDQTVFECVKDARSAVRYVCAHAQELGVDPDRIVACGASAGGHLALGTAIFDGIDDAGDDLRVSCRPSALLLFSPVADTSEAGYGSKKIGPRWRELSPLHRVKEGMPPALLFHGTADPTVPFAGVKQLHEEMVRRGNRCDFVVETGGSHAYMFKDKAAYEQCLRSCDTFIASLP